MKRLSFVACSVLFGAFLVVASLWFFQLKAEAGSMAQSALPPLFTDDFESGSGKWITQTNTCVSVVTDGGTQVYSVTNCGATTARTIVTETTVPGSTAWTDYSIQARVKVVYTQSVGSSYAMLMARYRDSRNYYFMTLRPNNRVEIKKYINGSSSSGGGGTVSSTAFTPTLGTWYTLKLEVIGTVSPTLRAFVDGVPVLTATDTISPVVPLNAGTIGVGLVSAIAEFDDVIVSPIAATLNVTKLGLGEGLVTSVPAGIDCGVTCTADFVKGTVITLTATPITGTSFGGWGGACLGPGTVIPPGTGQLPMYQCVLPMTAAMNVTVTFNKYYIFLPLVLKNY